MNRFPKKGDVITVEGKRGDWLVIDSTVPLFHAVPCSAADPVTGTIDARKLKLFSTEPVGRVAGSIACRLESIHLVTTATFKTTVTTTYTITKLKGALLKLKGV